MKKVIENPAEAEKFIKDYYGLPDYLMMENAASSLAESIKLGDMFHKDRPSKLFIACGKGNNGGDGLALARKVHCFNKNTKIILLCENVPVQKEAQTQYSILKKMEVAFATREEFIQELKESTKEDTIVDCLYGIGFHGQWKEADAKLIMAMNNSEADKIACDISSGLGVDGKAATYNGEKLAFKANCTICMGLLKAAYFSDDGKRFSGRVAQGNIGVPAKSQYHMPRYSLFIDDSEYADDSECSVSKSKSIETLIQTNLYLLDHDDFKIPYRFDPASHKGTYGHVAVFAGEKSGAAVLSATAALYAGTGLSTIVKTENSNLEQFKINPQLMVSKNLPEKTKVVVFGNGLGKIDKNTVNDLADWFNESKAPACVLDADIFYYEELASLLEKLSQSKNAKIVLTPHPKELASLAKLCKLGEYSIEQANELRKEIGLAFSKKYPQIALLMKGADTFIALNNNIYIFTKGNAALAKAGSGDILAGIIAGLLAQGYTTQDACFTGCDLHAKSTETGDYKKLETIGASDFRLLADDLLETQKGKMVF